MTCFQKHWDLYRVCCHADRLLIGYGNWVLSMIVRLWSGHGWLTLVCSQSNSPNKGGSYGE